MGRNEAGASSVREGEIANFNAMAARWRDPDGPMRMLLKMNPLRVGWIDQRIMAAHGRRGRLLDVGCGAGLASEALAALGHDVLGIDAAGETIGAARAHVQGSQLPLAYRTAAAEDLLAEGERFAAITALEVIEHVAEPAAFVRTLGRLLAPGGLLFVSTLNRTARSWVVAKLGAEYVLRLLPAGTHAWGQFVTPEELAAAGRRAGLRLSARSGMSFSPATGAWFASQDLGVNYIAMLSKPG